MMRLASRSRVESAFPSEARGLPDFLTVSHAESKADAKSAVVSKSKAAFSRSETIGMAVPYFQAGASGERSAGVCRARLCAGSKHIVGKVDYRTRNYLRVGLGKVKRGALSDQLITFTRRLHQGLPIKDRDLPSAAFNQAGAFQLPGGIRDGRPLNTQHFGEQVLSDRQCIIVSAVTHHEEPTRQPLLEAVRTVARDRYHHLFEKSVNVSVHQTSERRHRP